VHKDKISKIETTKLFSLPMVSTLVSAMDLLLKEVQALKGAIPTLDKGQLEEYFRYIIVDANAFVKDLQNPSPSKAQRLPH
jgi:hypothetical protein